MTAGYEFSLALFKLTANNLSYSHFTGLFTLVSCQTQRFHFVGDRKNFTEAQSFCRDRYTDLATINSHTDMLRLLEITPAGGTRLVWIGLQRGAIWRWHWSLSLTGFYAAGQRDFRNWRGGHPLVDQNKDGCAVMEPDGRWFEDSCETARRFMCYNATGNDSYQLIEENRSWRAAQDYCRSLHTDLVSVRNQTENQEIREAAQSQQVWIGLFKDPWVWSDDSNSSYRFWHTDNLVLIRENLTWSEALSYCRDNHVDLVSVPSPELQDLVVRKAQNASTPHVWLGLRYTCRFSFWFWTAGEVPGCYQNWAAGHGPSAYAECGYSGALEAWEGNRWVGLPDTERMNFICFTCRGRDRSQAEGRLE
ncbi:secretory phospholipase A2 receptor-like [Chanos chanos]|uniref:Secretory phospholipase A2 receptor-like n=1 Tax=Chanos chanos TaxID=29144 RepID=A0A6J2W4U2_CHACN|nr:secretory phospholipase A2 receptor-like [Chanos chanos]